MQKYTKKDGNVYIIRPFSIVGVDGLASARSQNGSCVINAIHYRSAASLPRLSVSREATSSTVGGFHLTMSDFFRLRRIYSAEGGFHWFSTRAEPHTSAITSTSTSAPLGSAFAATQERAGFSVKYFA